MNKTQIKYIEEKLFKKYRNKARINIMILNQLKKMNMKPIGYKFNEEGN